MTGRLRPFSRRSASSSQRCLSISSWQDRLHTPADCRMISGLGISGLVVSQLYLGQPWPLRPARIKPRHDRLRGVECMG